MPDGGFEVLAAGVEMLLGRTLLLLGSVRFVDPADIDNTEVNVSLPIVLVIKPGVADVCEIALIRRTSLIVVLI